MYKERIKREYPYKIEPHCHSSGASACADFTSEQVVEKYKIKGFDGIVLTNHFNESAAQQIKQENGLSIYREDYEKACKKGEELGIRVYFGLELRFFDSRNDYLYYGVSPEETQAIAPFMLKGLESFCKEYKTENSAIYQAHPFRNGLVCEESELLDGIEVFNMHPGHNSRIGFAAKYAKENHLSAIAGSDFHHCGHEGLSALRVKKMPEDSFELAKILKNGEYVIDISGLIILP